MIIHPIAPVYDENSGVLILGSFPSVKSREAMFYYGHPQNRFWKVISAVAGAELPTTVEEKKTFLLEHGIALWDVIGMCDIDGSSDNSVRNVRANDISVILEAADIRRIFVNGKCAQKYYDRYIFSKTGIECFVLPSTSPANAAFNFDKLMESWKIVGEVLNETD